MKYINQFTSIEDYITYKENNKNLPGVNRVIEDDISTTNDDYPNSFVFIDDENKTNYNIIRLKSRINNTQIPKNLNTVYNKCIYDNNSGDYVTTIITKNYLYNPLTEIPDYAFSDFNMVNIDLPETIKKIGNYAFENTYLKSITLNENISYVGNNAFAYCAWLTDIVFKNTNDIVLGKNILNGCESLNNITFYSTNPPIFDNIDSNAKYLFYNDSTTDFYKTITLPINYNYEDWFTLLSNDESFSIDKIRHKLQSGIGTQTILDDSIVLGEELKRVESTGNIIKAYTHADTETINIGFTYKATNVRDELINSIIHKTISLKLKKIIGTNESGVERMHTIKLSYNECEFSKSIDIRQSARTPVTNIIFDDASSEVIDYSDDAYDWEVSDEQPFYFQKYDGSNIADSYTGLPLLMFNSANYEQHNSVSLMVIEISNVSNFTFYILNHREGDGRDYMRVSQPHEGGLVEPNAGFSNGTLADDDIPVNSGDIRFTPLKNFKQVNVDSLDPSESYYIYISYTKDVNSSYGRGYVLLPMYREDVNIYYRNIWGEDYEHCPQDWDTEDPREDGY